MAFTTAPLPMDKDQGSFWPGNEELSMANDNFFDQYVSFEMVEPTTFDCGAFGNPPSPSLLLDSLGSLTNSSDGQDQPVAQHLVEASSARPGPPVFSIQHARSVPPLYDPQPDLALARGSISDSELLRLEGISLRSPRANDSTASSPRPMPSSPLSPRKTKRFIDSVHATVRKAVPRPPGAPGQALAAPPPPPDIKTEPGHHAMLQPPLMLPDGLMEPPYGSIDCHGLPLSPPLTGKMPTPSQQPRGSQFVTGHLEDPFSEGYMAIHPTRTQTHEEGTPLYTPVYRSDMLRHASQPMDMGHAVFQQQQQPLKQRGTSSAEWPVESPIARDSQAPWTAAAVAGHDGPNGWVEGAEGPPAGPGHPPSHHGLAIRMHPSAKGGRSYEGGGGPYEPADGLSGGLMIHMPQPRPPHTAAPLLTAPMPMPMPPPPPTEQQQQSTPTTPRRRASAIYPSASTTPHRPRGLYTDGRPRPPPPRAPTSGARHHPHGVGAALTSPRKLHRSASRPLLIHGHPHGGFEDEQPPASPTPSSSSSAMAAAAARRRSSSMSVRKQRSWSRREPRTPNVPPSSTTTSAACSPGLGLGDGGVDFVNFTPSDKTVLMQGVAPSGSSKTKARREKEALDRRRKLSEATYKAVQAAGGDIERLRAEVSSL